MEVTQTPSISHTVEKPKRHGNPRTPHFRQKSKTYWKTYNQKRLQYLQSKQKECRLKLKLKKPPKLPSTFQLLKQHQLLKLLVNHKSFVKVAPKLKHPTTKNWNADNYWYKAKLDLNDLPRGCVRIYEDQWNDCYIIWLDIDCKKWTKLAKIFRCGYVKSPKGHIRIPIPVQDLQGYKTGVLYYQDQKIGDAKLSGEVMLPGNAYYDKEGNFLGYYEYKAWGTFFPLNNRIWSNIEELLCYLEAKIGIEYKTISQHILVVKTKQKTLIKTPTPLKHYFSAREPPGLKVGKKRENNPSKGVNY